LNKTLQSSTYQLSDLKEDIDTTTTIHKADYSDFPKPPLVGSDDFDQETTIDSIMKHHLSFGDSFYHYFCQSVL